MKKSQLARIGISALVLLGMSITLPACPGQEELKQQVDQSNQQVSALSKRVAEIEGKLKAINEFMVQAETIFKSLGPLMQENKAKLDEMDKTLKDIQARLPGGKGKKAHK